MSIRILALAVLVPALIIGAGVGLARLDLANLIGLSDSAPDSPVAKREAEQPSKASPKAKASEASNPKASDPRATDVVEKLASQLTPGPAPAPASTAPAFDVALVNPSGVSVFAGRAKPFETVTVFVGTSSVGTVTADGDGNWSLSTERKIADPNGALSIKTGPVPKPEAAPPIVTASAPPPKALPTAAKTAADVNRQMIDNLNRIVDEARAQPETTALPASNVREPVEAADETPQTTYVEKTNTRVAALAQPDATKDAGPRTLPIPIQFEFRKAKFTPQGRRAAELLLEYIKVKKLERVTLSGHADERGSKALNMQLSERRLNVVRDWLREGGYQGELVLLPKGETEPFAGVDRKSLPRDELFQLDRRVELHLGS